MDESDVTLKEQTGIGESGKYVILHTIRSTVLLLFLTHDSVRMNNFALARLSILVY